MDGQKVPWLLKHQKRSRKLQLSFLSIALILLLEATATMRIFLALGEIFLHILAINRIFLSRDLIRFVHSSQQKRREKWRKWRRRRNGMGICQSVVHGQYIFFCDFKRATLIYLTEQFCHSHSQWDDNSIVSAGCNEDGSAACYFHHVIFKWFPFWQTRYEIAYKYASLRLDTSSGNVMILWLHCSRFSKIKNRPVR